MNKPHGIIVFGLNGSGKTTLGRELSRILNYKHMDHEMYAFGESEIPYTNERSYSECVNLMLADIEKYGSFVMSAVTGDFGEKITRFYELGVFISAPLDVRLERIKNRSYEKFGERVLAGGDMYENQQNFINFAASRPVSRGEEWAKTLTCPVIRVDGMVDWHINAKNIVTIIAEKI